MLGKPQDSALHIWTVSEVGDSVLEILGQFDFLLVIVVLSLLACGAPRSAGDRYGLT
jgi:hypothetical protein